MSIIFSQQILSDRLLRVDIGGLRKKKLVVNSN